LNEGLFYFLGIVFLLFALRQKLKDKENQAFALLLLSVLGFGLFAIFQYDFLFPWDERFHALVAKNMVDTPLEPKLYRDKVISEFDYGPWYKSHIWLHKQPWFLWQMAGSMSLFGESIYAMRGASLAMLLLFTISIYFATRRLNASLAFWLTIIAAFQPFLFNLINGKTGMEHNDIAFLAWVAFSFWGLIEHIHNPKKKTGLLMLSIGCGIAVLTKWLAGILVYGAWGLYLIFKKEKSLKAWLQLPPALLITAVIVLPWQLYIFNNYHNIALYEWEYNSKHLFEVLEGHVGAWHYHLKVWWENFRLIGFLIAIAFVIMLLNSKRKAHTMALFGSTLFVMLLFSIAKTKLPAYTLIALPPSLLAIAAASVKLNFNNKLIKALTVAIVAINLYSFFGEVKSKPLTGFEKNAQKQKNFYSPLKNSLPENAVLFNTPTFEHPEIMFYTNRIVYENIPSPEQIEAVKQKGYTPVFVNHPGNPLPKEFFEHYQVIEFPGY